MQLSCDCFICCNKTPVSGPDVPNILSILSSQDLVPTRSSWTSIPHHSPLLSSRTSSLPNSKLSHSEHLHPLQVRPIQVDLFFSHPSPKNCSSHLSRSIRNVNRYYLRHWVWRIGLELLRFDGRIRGLGNCRGDRRGRRQGGERRIWSICRACFLVLRVKKIVLVLSVCWKWYV